jgi:hypothetical protein
MGTRLNWSRPRRAFETPESLGRRRLERAADRFLEESEKQRKEPTAGDTELVYFRHTGSVMRDQSGWHALDGAGNVVGSANSRSKAWTIASALGMERVVLHRGKR